MEQWINENWYVSEYNYVDEVRNRFSLPKHVLFHDATLRDGEQMPGVVFRKEEKIEIAKKLDELGLDRIEAGMPAVSQEDFDAVKAICDLGLHADIYVLCRGMKKDIDMAVSAGVDGVVIETPSGYPRLKHQFPTWTEDDAVARSIETISYAKSQGLKVCFFPYDTTRAKPSYLERICNEIIPASHPDSMAIIDTVGVALPDAMYYLVKKVKSMTDIPIEVHTHNDNGMGTATTLAAVEAGAEVVQGCVTGLGERTGNAPLEQVFVAMKTLLGMELPQIKLEKLYETAKFISECSRVPLGYGYPVTGTVPYTRESGLGMDVLINHTTTILPINPKVVGRNYEMVLGKKSGKPSITIKLEQLGLTATDEEVTKILGIVKAKGIELKRTLTDDEFVAIVNEVKAN